MYKYRLIATGYSSSKYGPCEVCGKHASEVWHQIKYEYHKNKRNEGWKHNGDLFGHKECLILKRKSLF